MAGTAGPLPTNEAFEQHVQMIMQLTPYPEQVVRQCVENLHRATSQSFAEAVSLHHRSCPARKGGKECAC